MRIYRSLYARVGLAAILSGVAQALTMPWSKLTPPSRDAFYKAPDHLGHVEPGTVLRHRCIDDIAAFSSLPQNIKAAHQLLYRTTDNHGNATATVSTILVPHNANYSRVLSYQVAEDAAWLDCAPSYIFRRGADSGRGLFGGLETQAELLLVDAALEQGWVVNSPDHLGHSAAFLANLQSGYATLDSIRALYATRNLTGIDPDPDVALWGYSGGSIASDFAAELLPMYAPDVRLIGAAIGGTVPKIRHALDALNLSPLSGIVPNGILGLTHQYRELSAVVQQRLKPYAAAHFDRGASQCLLASVERFFMQDIYGYFDDAEALFNSPAVRDALAANDAGHANPTIPLFVYKAIHDEVSPIADTDALVDRYCAGATPVTYHRDEVSMHLILMVTGAPDAVLWLRDRFDGRPAAAAQHAGCSRANVTTSLDSAGAIEVLGKSLVEDLAGLIGLPIGPSAAAAQVRFRNA